MKNTKKVLEICLSPDLGGLELYMKECALTLSKDMDLISVIADGSKLFQYFNGSELEFYSIKRKSSFSITTAWKLAKLIDENQIELIHLHWTKDIPIVVLSKLFSKQKPKIVQTRHMTMTRFKDDFYHKFLYKNLDMILTVTKQVEKQVNEFIPQEIRPKTQTLYLGAKSFDLVEDNIIDQFKKNINPNGSFMVSLVGRINEFKGQHLLIESVKTLVSKGLKIEAFIIGHAMSESYLYSLKQRVKEYNLEKFVHFVGFTNEPEKYMQASDVVVMTSKNETFGLVVIEAMKNKTAVIGADSGGVLEIIDDRENGLLFKSGDFNDLSEKIKVLYDNEELKNTLAVNGKEKADKVFDKVIHFKKLKEILELL